MTEKAPGVLENGAGWVHLRFWRGAGAAAKTWNGPHAVAPAVGSRLHHHTMLTELIPG